MESDRDPLSGGLSSEASVYVCRHTLAGSQAHVCRRCSKYLTTGTVGPGPPQQMSAADHWDSRATPYGPDPHGAHGRVHDHPHTDVHPHTPSDTCWSTSVSWHKPWSLQPQDQKHCLTSEGPPRSFWRDVHSTWAIRRVQRSAADPEREAVETEKELLRGGVSWFVLKARTSCRGGQEAGRTAQSTTSEKSLICVRNT